MFELTQQQEMIRLVVRDFVQKELEPHIEKLEAGEMSPFPIMQKLMKNLGVGDMVKTGILKRIEKLRSGDTEPASDDEDDLSNIQQQDPMMAFVLIKELSRVSPGFAMSFGVSTGLAGGAVMKKGTADQLEKWALPLMTMEKIGSWCLTEPGAGSDAFGSMRTTAKPDGNGDFIVNGTKMFITNGPEADIFVVYAKLDDGSGLAKEEQPVISFVAEKGMEGLTTGKPLKKYGMKDSPTCEVFFDDVKIPLGNVLGDPKLGMRKGAKDSLGDERSGLPAMAWGIIEHAYEIARDYAAERKQFGKAIGEFQAVQLKLADIYTHLKNVENAVYRTAWMAKEGKRDFAFICSRKVYCAEAAVKATLEAMQILGGYGYMSEYKVEKLMRDSKLLEIGAGTTDINQLTVARLELGLAK